MIFHLRYFLVLFTIIQANAKNCPAQYHHLEADDVCLLLSTRLIELDDMESYCSGEGGGGKPFMRRLSDEGLDELNQYLWNSVAGTFPSSVYIGLKKDTEFQSTKWIFSNNEGSIEEKDYPLWNKGEPHVDCGVIRHNEGLKVSTQSCGQEAYYICRKKESPCSSLSSRYMNFFGRCLTIVNSDDSYQLAEKICEEVEGYLFPYRDESETNSVGAVIYNIRSMDGGIFTGLRRESGSEKWKYPDGEEEISRWDPNQSRDFDCAVLGFLANKTLGLFTLSCDQGLKFFCEYEGK